MHRSAFHRHTLQEASAKYAQRNVIVVQAFPTAPTNRIHRVARAVFCQMVYNHRDGDATCLEPRLRCVASRLDDAPALLRCPALNPDGGRSMARHLQRAIVAPLKQR